MTPEIDQDLFNHNLLLTQAYCELQLQKPFENNAKVLRTINPEVNGKPIFSFGTDTHKSLDWQETNWSLDPFLTSDSLYQELFDKQIAFKKEILVDTIKKREFKGRILIALLDLTLWEGASEAETYGFTDVFDCPPIDTWFYMSKLNDSRMLFAWVPERFIEAVDNGIAVNSTECYYWYNNDSVFINPFHYNEPTLAPPSAVKSQSLIERVLSFFRGLIERISR